MTSSQIVPASTTAVLGGAGGGKPGDLLDTLIVTPGSTSPGSIVATDGVTSYTLFNGGASSLTNLTPFTIRPALRSAAAGWVLAVGANLSVLAEGAFSYQDIQPPHYVTVPVVVAEPPVVGTPLSIQQGIWTGSPSSYTYQWYSDVAGAISGATSATYTPVLADLNRRLYCQVTASNSAPSGSQSVFTPTTRRVTPVPTTKPVNTVAPVITGTATVGSLLSGSNGTWNNSPSGFTYQWYQDSTPIDGQTLSSYLIASGDLGHTIKFVVTATNDGGSTSQASSPTATVTAGGVTPILDTLGSLPVSAWSSRVLKSSFVGTPMPNTTGIVTGFNDQVGTNNLSSVGSPSVNANGVGVDSVGTGQAFCNMNGTSQKLSMGSTVVFAGDFDIWCAIVGDVTNPTSQGLMGHNGFAGSYIRVHSAINNNMAFRNDAGTSVELALASNYRRGSHVYRFSRSGSTITVYLDGVTMGTVTLAGTMTLDMLGSTQNGNWLKGGVCEFMYYNGSILGSTDAGLLLTNMTSVWRSSLYYDPVSGNDANSGVNSAEALATLAYMRSGVFHPGQQHRLLAGSTFRRDPLFIAQSNADGSQASPITVDKYGPGALPLILGSEQFTSGWTQVLGDVWNITGGAGSSGAVSPACWIISGGNTYRQTSTGATFGLLTQGQSAVSGTTLQICMPTALTGVSPNSCVVEHAQSLSGQGDDNIHASNVWWTFSNLKTMYSTGDGCRLNGAGSAASSVVAWYNSQDGHGQGNDGSQITVLTSCDSQFNGSGDTTGGSDGDGFSSHGSSKTTFVSCTANSNDKSSFNHEESTTIVQTNCTGLNANLPLNYLDQPGTNPPGTWTITGGTYKCKPGSSITYVLGALSSNHVGGAGANGGGVINLSGVTLDTNGSGGACIFSPSTSYVNVAAVGCTLVGTQQSWSGHGTISVT